MKKIHSSNKQGSLIFRGVSLTKSYSKHINIVGIKRLQQKMNELRERIMVGAARFVAKRNLEAFIDGIKRDDLPFEHLAANLYTPPSQVVVSA
jgi:hypothetical protein